MWYFASGDAGFYFTEQLKQLSWLPVPWHSEYGFGAFTLDRMWFDYPYLFVIKALSSIGFSWWFIDKLLWLAVTFVAVYSSYRLAKYILGNAQSATLGSIIYSANTYILLLFAGGQIGVALAYALLPLVLLKFIESVDSQKADIQRFITNGLWFALLIAFDLRFAYLVVLAILLYIACSVEMAIRRLVFVIKILAVPFLVAGLVHFFWILPELIAGGGGASSLGNEFTNPGILKFLSFADFSHAFGLLHPNWPENLFGKVYFMQPEFLIIPILAFCAFLFIEKKSTDTIRKISFFALIVLIGAFFAKGVTEPFGGIFQWMFVHIPGFIMFRDPTKFYVFVTMGYSVLLPYALMRIGGKIRLSEKTIFIVFIAFWCFTLRPVFLGQMKGNFQPPYLTTEYVQLKNTLVSDPRSSRTLWIPQKDAFAYMSEVHPFFASDQLFHNASISAIIVLTQKPEFMKSLADSGIGYVIVPTDLEKRLFLTDYRFNPDERDNLISALRKTNLIQDKDFTNVAVFKNTQFTMISTVPMVVEKQQKAANIGLGISVITLITSMGMIIFLKRRT